MRRAHELTDVSTSFLGWLAVFLILFGVVAFLLIGGLRDLFYRGLPYRVKPLSVPAMRVEIDSGEEYREVRQEEEALIHQYGWIDRKTGIVKIPIDQAIDLFAAKESERK